MNLFVLDLDPHEAAKYHVDKHVVKMILETAQLLCNAHHLHGSRFKLETLYKPTHVKHPCSLWVAENTKNYSWSYELFLGLCKEYTFRYEKIHATQTKLAEHLAWFPDSLTGSQTRTPFAQCMPDECKDSDPVVAYRKYYVTGKRKFAKWSKRGQPDWWIWDDTNTT